MLTSMVPPTLTCNNNKVDNFRFFKCGSGAYDGGTPDATLGSKSVNAIESPSGFSTFLYPNVTAAAWPYQNKNASSWANKDKKGYHSMKVGADENMCIATPDFVNGYYTGGLVNSLKHPSVELECEIMYYPDDKIGVDGKTDKFSINLHTSCSQAVWPGYGLVIDQGGSGGKGKGGKGGSERTKLVPSK